MTGKVIHFELPADDVARAGRFYGEVFGWQVVPGPGYTLVTTTPSGDAGPLEAGAINGGVLARRDPITAPVIIIQVDDIDAALTTAERAGARTAIGRQQVGEIGFSAYLHDPEGNLIGLFQPAR